MITNLVPPENLIWRVKPKLVQTQLVSDVNGLFAKIPGQWAITQGKRFYSDQEKLYEAHLAGGPLAAPPGHSAHEGGDDNAPGLAVDFCEIVDGKDSWETNDRWQQIWDACRASPRMHSGHFFPPIAPADDDHIQSVYWYVVRAQLQAAGKW